jgi:hypothetical protein
VTAFFSRTQLVLKWTYCSASIMSFINSKAFRFPPKPAGISHNRTRYSFFYQFHLPLYLSALKSALLILLTLRNTICRI